MSEMPERKVLKNILLKLKKKTITSEDRHRQFSSSIRSAFKVYTKETLKIAKDWKRTIDKKGLAGIFAVAEEEVKSLIRNADGVIEDMKLYIEALENYCAELDKTLWEAIEQAKKEAEEQIKQQKELMKRKAPESYRV